MRSTIILTLSVLTFCIATGCNSLGMLLFYRDAKTETVFRSSESKKDYFIIKATTLSHCGCTDLYVDNYNQGRKDFNIFYAENVARKTVYKFNQQTNKKDTLRLLATPYDNYTIAFDSLDTEIFKRINTIAIEKPKEIIYKVKSNTYKGFITDPYYTR